MNEIVSYNDAVRQYFFRPDHAGDLQDRYDVSLTAEVSESAHGAHVVLAAGIDGETVSALAYRVRGCPHLVAALELLCTKLENRPVAALEKLATADITQELGVPVEKSGRILLLEDAVAMLWSQFAAAAGQASAR